MSSVTYIPQGHLTGTGATLFPVLVKKNYAGYGKIHAHKTTTKHNKAWCYVPSNIGISRNVSSFCDINLYYILWQSGAEIP